MGIMFYCTTLHLSALICTALHSTFLLFSTLYFALASCTTLQSSSLQYSIYPAPGVPTALQLDIFRPSLSLVVTPPYFHRKPLSNQEPMGWNIVIALYCLLQTTHPSVYSLQQYPCSHVSLLSSWSFPRDTLNTQNNHQTNFGSLVFAV